MTGPVSIGAGITALLRSMPDPDTDQATLDNWILTKADLLDRIADAAATPELADEARACATAARLSVGVPPTSHRHTADNRIGGTR